MEVETHGSRGLGLWLMSCDSAESDARGYSVEKLCFLPSFVQLSRSFSGADETQGMSSVPCKDQLDSLFGTHYPEVRFPIVPRVGRARKRIAFFFEDPPKVLTAAAC